MNSQSIACTATFMMEGMLSVEQKHRVLGPNGLSSRDLYTIWDEGGIELHMKICEYAEIAEKACEFVINEDTYDFPGVYDYEVSELFGNFFADYLFKYEKAPPEADAIDKLLRDTAIFVTQYDEDKLAAGVLYNKLKMNL